MTRVHLCDYGVGNIHNVRHAFAHVGAEVVQCTSADMLDDATAVVIPGVGAFGDCITRFREAGFEAPVRKLVESGAPLIGICVGMQMLATSSEEFGEFQGLDLIPGRVLRLPDKDAEGKPLKLPHIAWSGIRPGTSGWKGTMLEDTEPGEFVYFDHSYALECENPDHVLATCAYRGIELTVAVGKGRIFGVQFHPEKSAEAGLGILRRFLHIASGE